MSYIKPEFEAIGSTGDLKDYRVISASKEKDGTFTFKVELRERKVSNLEKILKELWEIIKEAGRTFILAILSYVATETVVQSFVLAVLGDRLSFELVIIVSGALTAVLRGIEKRLHKADKLSLPF